jgi:hypothetical protein
VSTTLSCLINISAVHSNALGKLSVAQRAAYFTRLIESNPPKAIIPAASTPQAPPPPPGTTSSKLDVTVDIGSQNVAMLKTYSPAQQTAYFSDLVKANPPSEAASSKA